MYLCVGFNLFEHAALSGIFINFDFMNLQELITIDTDILGGLPVFKGTRVPVESLFDHLEAGVSLDEFLDDFPTVSKEQAVALLDIANKLITSKNVAELYATVT
ncbi:MAG: DUF433 domain-containing protein [Chitinophagaceae bacterium]